MAQRQQRNTRGQFKAAHGRTNSRQQPRLRRSGTRTVLSLVAGAGVGLAIMYLFDPEAGARRRRRIAARSGELFDSSKDLALSAAGSASEASHSLGASIAGKAAELAHRAKARGSRAIASLSMSNEEAIERAKETLASLSNSGAARAAAAAHSSSSTLAGIRDYLADRAHGAREYATDTAHTLKHRMNLALGREGEEHHYARQAACAVGSLALGAGLVWMFDPRLGRSRRTWLRDKSLHWMHETGDMFRYLGVHASNQLRGTVAQTRGYFHRNEPVDDTKLCARVRSELGRVIEDLRAVEVVAQDGHVTLRGTADGAEISSIASAILGIRGVRGLDNQLRTQGVHATTSQSPAV